MCDFGPHDASIMWIHDKKVTKNLYKPVKGQKYWNRGHANMEDAKNYENAVLSGDLEEIDCSQEGKKLNNKRRKLLEKYLVFGTTSLLLP